MRRPKKRHKKFIIPRTTVLIFIFAALSMVLIHRLFSLQIIHGQEYADNFSIMTTKTRTLKSTRGNIYDRNGQVLASNELSYSITLEDSGDYANNTERNRSLNGEIYKIIQIIEATEMLSAVISVLASTVPETTVMMWRVQHCHVLKRTCMDTVILTI